MNSKLYYKICVVILQIILFALNNETFFVFFKRL